jgi:two-component system, sensor histidine kinase PdtaS
MQVPSSELHTVGAIITIHDETEDRRRARELKLKTEMLLELQHRVRNSLQTITALMRMQSRRAESAETRAALEEAVNRILHVAAVHEFLFDPNERRVNLRSLTQRLVDLSRPLVPPSLTVHFHVEGEDVFITGERATPAALVISELILNAIEHAFKGQAEGNVWIRLGQAAGQVEIQIRDDGRGAPDGFAPDMGLSLVNTLTREGLRGEFSITNDADKGAVARVTFAPHPSRRNGNA